MQIKKKNESSIRIFFVSIFTIYLIWGTGVFPDDYSYSRLHLGKNFRNFFDLSYENLEIMIFRIPEYLLFHSFYYFVDARHFFFDFLKNFMVLI